MADAGDGRAEFDLVIQSEQIHAGFGGIDQVGNREMGRNRNRNKGKKTKEEKGRGQNDLRLNSATRSTYDHPKERFNAGHEFVPPLTCGMTPGNCVHINTYILAALLAVPIRATYIAGYFFDTAQPIADNMHCWIATEADGKVEFWDVAHHQLYGLGAVETALNPAPGTRFAMSAGRGLVFHVDQHRIEVSHFAKPIWLFSDGTSQDAQLEARIAL